MKINSLNKIKILTGKTVFLRVDFNVPIKGCRVKDDHRIKAGLETINFLIKRGARLVIASHLGEPKGIELALSLKPVVIRLKSLLKQSVKFLPDAIGPKTAA